MMKRCNRCYVEKELIDFYKNNANIDKLHNACKECEKEKSRLRRPKKKEKIVYKSCSICAVVFDDITKHGTKGKCTYCYNKQFYAINKELVKKKYIQNKLYLESQNYEKLRNEKRFDLKSFIVNIENKDCQIDFVDAYKLVDFFEIYYDGAIAKYDHLSVEDQLIIFWEYLIKLK
jgi:hypothetical protein